MTYRILSRFPRAFLGALATLAALSSCATFTGEIPVGTEIPEISYISPSNADGVQDRLVLPVRVDAPYDAMIVGGYRFTVSDAAGAVVHVTEEQVVAQGAAARVAQGVAIPETLVWDGRTTGGDWAADGEYSWRVEVWDTRGNTGATRSLTVIVDNTAPFLVLTVPQPLFSPNEDGNLDTLVIEQDQSTTEDLWSGEIFDALGHSVVTPTWVGPAIRYVWDGKDEAGTAVPDGSYTYAVTSRDRAGNSATFTARGITVDTNPTAVSLGVTSPWLSPNGDGVRDIVQFLPRAAQPETVTAWTIALRDDTGATRRRYGGAGNLPERVEFDGRDDTGAALPDGTYTARLTVTYPNGATPSADADPLGIDTVQPTIRVDVDYPVFSPDGDGSRDSATFEQTSSSEDRWNGVVLDAQGRVVLTKSWVGEAGSFTWDGRDDAGWALADGPYTYRVEGTDRAGNTIVENVTNLRLDRRPAAVTLASSVSAFSPNGDGVLDTVDFYMTAKPADGIDEWRLAVTDTQGRDVIAFEGRTPTTLPSWIAWDGRTPQGRAVAGQLKAELSVRYQRGSVARVALELVSDLSSPALAVQVAPRPFSPDEDGVDDTLSIRLTAEDPAGIGEWTVRILDPEGHPFQQFRAVGAPPSQLVWDGRSTTGELAQSATDYELVFLATDGAGNAGQATADIPVDILILREGERLRIVISSIYFKEDTPDYRSVPADRATSNIRTLDRLAERLLRFPQHQIRVEGHGVSVYWNDPVRAKAEEEAVLQPLSLARAEAVRAALVDRGIPALRMTAVGFGGTQPVVPHGDLGNRWKNRRVEFVLERR